MKVTRTCRLNQKTYTMDIPLLDPAELANIEEQRKNGIPIQVAAPYLRVEEREFLITGTPPEVWIGMFGPTT